MRTYSIQISQKITVSKDIKAKDIDAAIDKAKAMEDAAHGDHPIVKPARGWRKDWNDETEIVGIF